jgi:hypothetical protein
MAEALPRKRWTVSQNIHKPYRAVGLPISDLSQKTFAILETKKQLFTGEKTASGAGKIYPRTVAES